MINYRGQQVTWLQERLSTVQVQTSGLGMSLKYMQNNEKNAFSLKILRFFKYSKNK